MSKIFLKLLVIFTFMISNTYAEIIKNIEISGNKRISNETVKVLSGISINEDFDNTKLNQSLKRLYDSNFFSDIKISFEQNNLKILLVENPIIEIIEINGIKNKEFLKEISESIVLKDRMSFSEGQLEQDITLINNILKSQGFYFAKIDSSLSKNEELNSVRLRLDIDRGDRARIKEIKFIGDKKIKDKKLLEVIASEEHKFWKFISNKVYLNQSLINLDTRLLENYYRNLGYHNVRVLNSFAEFSEESYFKLVFNIDSGEKFFFNDLILTLPEDYNKSDFKKIDNIFNKIKGKSYSLDRVNLILDEIDRIASSRLYDFINIEVDEKVISENKLNFQFIVKDSEKFYVEKINILGNFNTIEEVIRNKLVVDEGDPYNKLLFNKSINQIKSLGIFKSVNSNIEDGSNPNTKIVNISVKEQPTGEISLGAGFGTDGGVIGGSLTERNFLGKGIILDSDLRLSTDGVKGKITYAKPNFNYSDNTLFTSIKSTTQDSLANYGYKITSAGLSIGTEYEQYESLFFRPELSFTQENLTTNSSASSTLKKQEGSYSDFYFNYGLTYDSRDVSFNPTKGNVISFSQDLPISATDNEIKNTFIFTKYKKFKNTSDMIGKASIYLTSVTSIDGSDVRISKRAQVPSSRLRGFEKGKIGPVDNGDFIGGNYATSLNFSTNLPAVLNTVESLDFSYFVDIANVWGIDYDSSIDDSNHFRSSTGIAIDYLSPIGPMNFSFTQPITKKSSDKTETFRFNLGTSF